MEVKRLRILGIDIFALETLNGLNPKFMADMFHHSSYSPQQKYNLYVKIRNTSKYGDKSCRVLGAHI